MKFSLKNIFKRKSKQDTAPAAAATEETAAPAIEEAEEPAWTPPTPAQQLERFKEPEGYYVLDLKVTVPGRQQNGHYLHMLENRDTGFLLASLGPQFLTGVKQAATQVEDHIAKDFGIDIAHVYFKRKDAPFYFDGYDELLGLPPGDGFQLVLVPEGCNWAPPFSPPPMQELPGTSTVLQHPATLLPQFQPSVRYPIIMVNGYDIAVPQLPKIPVNQPAPQQNTAVTIPAALPPKTPKM